MSTLRYANPLNAIDIDKLPAPDVVEDVDFDTLLAERLDALTRAMRDHDPEYQRPTITDPAYQIHAAEAYRELLTRQRINDAARAVMLAYAQGSNLAHLAAFWGVERALVTPANPNANPPQPAVYETDASLLRRVLLAPEALTTAGSRGSYLYHALSADPARVADASFASPSPNVVIITVLALAGDGTPSDDLLATVNAALSAEDVRPWGDQVSVAAPEIVNYQIDATAYFKPGPDIGAALDAARAAWDNYTAPENRRLGADVTMSRIESVLVQPGMHSIAYRQPTASVIVDRSQYARCTSYRLANGGIDE